MKNKVIVVGAGASGLMAAGCAALHGAEVLLIEKMSLPGRKIGISGKGRCNLTNTAELSDFISHFGKNGKFLRQSFAQFFSNDLVQLLDELNFPTQVERGGRVFPTQGKKATDVVKVLEKWVKKSGCFIKTSTAVTGIRTDKGQIRGVETSSDFFSCNELIMATGGASYPLTGSTGDGYTFLKDLGHSIVTLRPALIPLICSPKPRSELNSLTLKNIKAKLFVDKKKKHEELGEVSFTPKGLAGPLILTMSSQAVDAVLAKKNVKITLDLKPGLREQQLDARLIRDLQKKHDQEIADVMRGLLPKQLIPTCLSATAVLPTQKAGILPARERKKIGQWLKNLEYTIVGYEHLDRAIVTAGGVKLQEVNPKTMESKLIKGLHIVGELLDIHGDTGGFNLQAAFSTGWVSGLAVSGKIN